MSGFWGAAGRLRVAPEEAVLRIAVVAIATVQAIVLGLLARRGSWHSDDLVFLVQGGRGFAPGELLAPVNDHIAPGLRFVYAVFARLAPLNHDVTVVWRVLMQAIAIALMGFLLLRLLGTSWWGVAGTALYALTPLSMPSFMSLASAVNNLPTHVFGLLVLHATLDWYAGSRRQAVAYGPLSLLISLACWEKSGLILVTAVALALYPREVPLRQWLRQSRPLATAFAVPVVAFSIFYAVRSRPSEGHLPGFGELLRLAARSFAVPVGALAGGPWRWTPVAVPYGLSDAPAGAVVMGAVVLVFLLVAAWRMDRRVLLVWGSLLVHVLTTWLLLSYGRVEIFGGVLHYHYWSDSSIPLTLAVALTARSVRPRVQPARFAPAAVACCLIAWTVGIVVSDTGFARLWGQNPARAYFGNVTADLENAGPSVNLWDVSMPSTVSTFLSEDNRLSPVLRTAGVPFRLQGPGSDPYTVSETGHLQPATLDVRARNNPLPKCKDKLQGTTPLTQPLHKPMGDYAETRWFAKFAYVSGREVRVLVELIDADGKVVAMPVPAAPWPSNFANMYFGPSAPIRPVAVRLRTTDPAASVCVGEFLLGLPKGTG